MLTATASNIALGPASRLSAKNAGAARTANRNRVTGVALGRAGFTVQPIHLRRVGTIALGSALQK
jgi:hypothetical protein